MSVPDAKGVRWTMDGGGVFHRFEEFEHTMEDAT